MATLAILSHRPASAGLYLGVVVNAKVCPLKSCPLYSFGGVGGDVNLWWSHGMVLHA